MKISETGEKLRNKLIAICDETIVNAEGWKKRLKLAEEATELTDIGQEIVANNEKYYPNDRKVGVNGGNDER